MLLDHPVRHQVKLSESDVKKLIEIMEEAGRDESLHTLIG
jgi:hypothetical protein